MSNPNNCSTCSYMRINMDKYGVFEQDYGGDMLPLFAFPPAAQVPPGWQLVPKEPTPDMLMAVWIDNNQRDIDSTERLDAAYAAMLAASPEYKE